MKATSQLLRIVQSRTALEKAWRVIQENARTSTSDKVKAEVDSFAENATRNINSLSTRLSKKTFKFGEATGILAAKANSDGTKSRKKFRPIVLAPLTSRIVQRAILDALGTIPELQIYAENPFSFGGIRKRKNELAAVPAAVQAALGAIGAGATHVAFADINAFFTKIPKATVVNIVAEATNDPEFMILFEEAIRVELENMAQLKENAKLFPIESIGVAQGNSLSPLLGNILLHEFDRLMNDGDCTCIRYIDDFIILAPTAVAAKSRLSLAVRILSEFDMSLSAEKSISRPIPVTKKFDFLGIEFNNGFIRPSGKAIARLEDNVKKRLLDSSKSMRTTKPGGQIPRNYSLIATLGRVDGIIRGWGKHYRFCNDDASFARIDEKMRELIRQFLGEYSDIKRKRPAQDSSSLLGIDELARQERTPLAWPKAS